MGEPLKTLRNRDRLLAVVLLALSLAGHLFLLSARHSASVVSGDEGTFLAMTESLALDGDLVFGAPDLERLEAAPQRGRKSVILQEYGDRIAYSKPVLYPLLAAPWYRLGGVAGLIALNVVALAAAMWLAWSALSRFGWSRPAVTVATFGGTSVVLGYAAWTMSDSLQASMTLAGLALGLAGVRDRAVPGEPGSKTEQAAVAPMVGGSARLFDRAWAPYLGVALVALTAGMRLPNLVLAAAPVLAWLFRGRWRRAVLLGALVVIAGGVGFAFNHRLAGAFMPYKTVRATFNPESGYPVGAGAETAREQFSDKVALATQVIGVRPNLDPVVSSYSAFYFLAGRHSGLLWYFPIALILVAGGLRRPDAVSWAVLLTVAALVAFYLVWMPRNYFGGATFLGNRYFLTGYMGLLFVPRRSLSAKGLAWAWLVAVVVFLSACVSVLRTPERQRSSQSHAYAGLFRLLPYEATARDIDGRRDVYWTEEFFRFVDPYAVVDPTGFTLRAGDPGAEVLHANQREAAVVRFLARTDAGSGRLHYRGHGQELSFDLEPNENGAWGLVEIELKPARRRLAFWFHPDAPLWTRTHRFRLERVEGLAAGEERSAEVHYLGSMRLVPKFFRGVVMEASLPETAVAGGSESFAIRVRNTGSRFWSSSEMVPTRLGYRIYRLPRRPDDRPVRGRLQGFEGRVPRGSELETELEVRWPAKSGLYELVIDLNLGGAIWYGAWNQAPLARAEVRVGPISNPGDGRGGDPTDDPTAEPEG